jgi:hypothetical protein
MIKKLHKILAKVTQQVPIMEVMNTKKSRIRQSKPGKQHFRQVTVQYYLTVELLRKPICKGCKLKTLSESHNFFEYVLEKKVRLLPVYLFKKMQEEKYL